MSQSCVPFALQHAACLNSCLHMYWACRSMLKEGWYSSTVEGAIWSPNSQFDNLMSVAGADKFGNKRADYLSVTAGGIVTDSISLYGGFKGAGWVLPEYNKTLVGIQRRPTWLNYFQGPETALTVSGRPWVVYPVESPRCVCCLFCTSLRLHAV